MMGFALAEAFNGPTRHYVGLTTHGDAAMVVGTTLVVRPDVASAQINEEAAKTALAASGATATSTTLTLRPHVEQPADDDTLRRFYAVTRLDPERYQRDFSKLAAEIIANLAGLLGTEVEISVEVKAVNAAGFPEHITRTVIENARTLKLDSFGFETE
jgi:hypothetical protein